VGLVQREIERAGIATVTLSPIPDLTAAVGAPRVAAIAYPPGRPFGRPNDAAGQTAVLRAALAVAHDAATPGAVVELPFEWPEPPARVRTGPAEPPPITVLLKKKPWLLPHLLRREPPS
jgi:D-proline reductase (dithiol) PrdB